MIIGTAGHIDHGKSALVERLTGIDPDRWEEEKRRGMTIDLGFAHGDLPGFGPVALVDVPGHERFVRNMVAGATGIDVVLLVVAADDGIMPQTIEHLDIVHLLDIRRGVVALNKADLVDEERLRRIAADLRALLADTALAAAPVVPVSARTGSGLDALREHLARACAQAGGRECDAWFRMPVDRAFSLPGIGTVATGTVVGGEVCEGHELRLLPGGKIVRVRGIQQHNRATRCAGAGERCAVNLARIEPAELERGCVLSDPGLRRATRTVDALVTLSRHAREAPAASRRLHLHTGTARVAARSLWLRTPPRPGQTAVAQLRLEQPVALLYRDRFILRDGGGTTVAGGVVLDPFASRRKVRDALRLARLDRLARFDAEEALGCWLEARGPAGWRLDELAEQLARPTDGVARQLENRADLLRHGEGVRAWIAPRGAVESLARELAAIVGRWLAENPRRSALSEATLYHLCPERIDRRVFRRIVDRLVERGELVRAGDGLRTPGHRQQFSPAEQRRAAEIGRLLDARRGTPPRLGDLAQALSMPKPILEDFLGELEYAGEVVRLDQDIYATRRDVDTWRRLVPELAKEGDGFTLARFRDAAGVGREFALKVLEHFDRCGVTRRHGSLRSAARSEASA
ncbi:selenocysteine-specific translation elongation factor [Thioalkalivibrio denitrificans]|uniref:Selenocysteine-specific elongation factor n=1 Tax=Thioalkalivibrio denitrificans TaxID=108003 RepID=A0A1V3NRW0_9GAMM|nr:selenocysteine-specific translation elongation factor [Thioalkalivibrio denitrificans]OOG27703.1 selenocysteine-specific translation elongation factor [Thioalkalivibrio denitrificans]